VDIRKGAVEGLVTKKLEKTFAGRKVLVTGHTGFKGSWLCLWLSELNAEVFGYALEPQSENDNFVVSNVQNRIQHIIGDVRDHRKLESVFNDYRPEFVFHLAAKAIVSESYLNPKETYDVNVGGTVNVLECCRQSDSVRSIVNVTSDKCYDNKNWVWGYRENDPLGGYDPYSSSKGCSELVTSAYRDSFFTPKNIHIHRKSLSSVRAGNVIGGGDWSKDRIVPDSIRCLRVGRPITVRNPNAVRPWQYVLEPLAGYLLLSAKMYQNAGQYEGAWNFGPERDSFVSVRELVGYIIDNWGAGGCEEFSNGNGFHEAGLLALDITKSRTMLGWKPILNCSEAAKLTVEWYKTHEDRCDMNDLCMKHIHDYMERMDESR
jgi:CDP-glucose 4,6-dehydratase